MLNPFKLPRVRAGDPITSKDGRAVSAFVIFWDRVMGRIETQEARQDDLLAAILAAQEAAAQAQAAAETAQAAATQVGEAVLVAQDAADSALAAVDTIQIEITSLDERITALEP